LYPSVDATATADRQEGVNRAISAFFGGGRIFWELDIWGRIRRLTEAARAQYLSQEAVQLAVIQSLVTGVASSYFHLLELDQELQVANQSLVSRQASLRMVQARLVGGLSNQLEVDQATSLVASAAVLSLSSVIWYSLELNCASRVHRRTGPAHRSMD